MYCEGGHSSSSGSWLFKIRSRDWLRFARPSLVGVLVQEISNHLSVFVSDFRFLSAGKRASRSYKTKIRKQLSLFPDFLRRERDSNPRYLSVRRFSRPVQSTTLPPLHELFFNKNVVSSCLMVQRYIKKIYRARKMEKKLNILWFFLQKSSEWPKKHNHTSKSVLFRADGVFFAAVRSFRFWGFCRLGGVALRGGVSVLCADSRCLY